MWILFRARLSMLGAAISLAGLEPILRTDGPYTVFAPHDGQLLSEAMLGDTASLAQLLMGGIVRGLVPADGLVDGAKLMTLTVLPLRQIAGFKTTCHTLIGPPLLSFAL